jgi:hypothetical protein
MYTEHGVTVDLEEVTKIIDNADVFAVAFRLFPERLLVDTRYDTSDTSGRCTTPMMAIVDPVESVQERFFWLGQHRPTLGMPKNFMFFFWPHSVRYLEESGVWERLRRRMGASGFTGALETCDEALDDLKRREFKATAAAIRGERYHTVWSASS